MVGGYPRFNLTSPCRPCATGICSTRPHTPDASRSRVSSDKERRVMSSSALSGMTLLVVPACIRPTVATTGSNTLNCRVTNVCIACTTSHAMGTGSAALCGMEPWPPRPIIRPCTVSAAARIGPLRQPITPEGSSGATCRAKTESGFSPASSTPSSSIILAPPYPSSPG